MNFTAPVNTPNYNDIAKAMCDNYYKTMDQLIGNLNNQNAQMVLNMYFNDAKFTDNGVEALGFIDLYRKVYENKITKVCHDLSAAKIDAQPLDADNILIVVSGGTVYRGTATSYTEFKKTFVETFILGKNATTNTWFIKSSIFRMTSAW